MASSVASNFSESASASEGLKPLGFNEVSKHVVAALRFRRSSSDVSRRALSVPDCAEETKDNGSDVSALQKPRASIPGSDMSLLRRRSTLKGVVNGITSFLSLRRFTIRTQQNKPKIKYENTYKLTPELGEHVVISKMIEVAQEVLKEEIGQKDYDSKLAGMMACTISNKIKNRVKELNFKRYRIVCQVLILEVENQGMEAASRCLWNDKTDNHASVTYNNDKILSVALIYAVYLD